MNFEGKVAIVTGASSGIGRVTAAHFARLGASVTLSGRNGEELAKSVDLCISQTGGALAKNICSVQVDLVESGSAQTIVDETIKQFGRIDILVNNAGIIRSGSIETASLQQFDLVMNTNVRTVYELTQLVVPHLIKTKGNIVNVSSITGLRAFAGVLPYCISKCALDQMTRCVALELASKGVRVNSVNPGVISTNLLRNDNKTEEQIEAVSHEASFLERSKTTHALGRVGSPEEVASTIAFLASDLASNITAAQLPCDGGRHALCPR